tara:strand:+ start:436 stop:1980 length:1545 start_codon:yes stop_codon:yes gene_type:complete
MYASSPKRLQFAGLLLVLSISLSFTSLLAQSELDDAVPYQGDTLISNPNQFRVSSEGNVLMDCDWPRMMSMIRDLEERIAGVNSADTLYGQYFTGSVVGNVLHMTHDCAVLRDTILALQVTYDNALTPKILSTTIAGVSDSTVIIDCSFQGSTVTSMGYKFADNDWTNPLTLNAPDLVTPRKDTIPDDDFSLTFSAAKTYYVHAFVTDGSETISGDTLTFTTLAQVQSSSPTPGYTTVDLAGAVSGESVQSSGFYWSDQSDLTGATDVSVSPVAGEVTYKLTGLAQADTIYFTTYATNENGDYNYGDTLKVGTRSCTSPTMDDYTYGTALIFEKCWLSENLRTSEYQDGSAIPKIEADAAWASDSNGGQAIYNNDNTTFYADYGRLYNWYAVNNAKGLCPTGWSVPTKGEYEALIDSLGGASVAAGFLKAAPSDSVAWNGTNDYGFTMVDGGGRLADGVFILQPDNAFLWTSSAHPSETSDAFSINFLDSYGPTTLAIQDPDQNSGMSVRCIKD